MLLPDRVEFHLDHSRGHREIVTLGEFVKERSLHTLAREKPVDRFAMNAQHTADADGVEPTVVNQTPDRLRVDAELVGDLTNADKLRLLLRR